MLALLQYSFGNAHLGMAERVATCRLLSSVRHDVYKSSNCSQQRRLNRPRLIPPVKYPSRDPVPHNKEREDDQKFELQRIKDLQHKSQRESKPG